MRSFALWAVAAAAAGLPLVAAMSYPANCNALKAFGTLAERTTDGVYTVWPSGSGGASYQVYCDQTVDGGGWTLTYAYNHAANAVVTNKPGIIPTSPSTGFSHVDLNYFTGVDAADVLETRFYCTSSGHGRKVHFKMAKPAINAIAFTGSLIGNTAAQWVTGWTPLAGHSATLPAATNSGYASAGDGFWNFPFFDSTPAYSAWAMGYIDGNYWLCDDHPSEYGAWTTDTHKMATQHLVFARLAADTPEPTHSPTLAPSQVPTLVPSLAPTVSCPRGYTFNGRKCAACPIGSFSNVSKPPFATECTLCHGGTFTNKLGSTKCNDCPTGKLSSPDRTYCSDCRAGQYSFNQTECRDCEAGRYAPQALTNNCLECGAGEATHINGTGATRCSFCDAGFFSAADSNMFCSQCPAGTYSPSGQDHCRSCDSGTFAPLPSSSSCTRCGAGEAVATASATGCVACRPGRYQSKTGEAVCDECVKGKFSKDPGGLSCTVCAQGYASMGAAVTCTLAAPGYFINPTTSLAAECPGGAFCRGGNEMPRPRPGYWVDRRNLKFIDALYACGRETCAGSLGSDDRGEGADVPIGCWSDLAYNASWLSSSGLECDSNALQCKYGSAGPLCGHCLQEWVYSSSLRVCVECESSWVYGAVVMAVGLLGGAVAVGLYTGRLTLSASIRQLWVVGVLLQIDSGTFRVVWSNYQIIQSVAWNLNVNYPEPFRTLVNSLSLFSFDFLSLECLRKNSNHFTSVILWSITPIGLAAMNFLTYLVREQLSKINDLSCEKTHTKHIREHTYWFLFLTYVVLPPVSRKQFQALDCAEIAGRLILRIDTSINCDTAEFAAFKVIDGLFIFVYMSMPLLWVMLLFHKRHRLNPGTAKGEAARQGDLGLRPLRFLYGVYTPRMYYMESLEMFRRVLLVGALPLFSSKNSRRAAFGVFFALVSGVIYRELEPFERASTNILVYVAQYTVLLTFAAALVIDTGMTHGLDDFAFGLVLLATNLLVVVLAAGMATRHHYLDEQRKKSNPFQRLMSSQEHAILEAVMNDRLRTDGGQKEGLELIKPRAAGEAQAFKVVGAEERLLKQYLISASDLTVTKCIGQGAFGEVFLGSCQGQPAAIKTMIKVTEATALEFRAEILLTANLRHPNIVCFIGACWTRSLTCLVLEFVPRGTMSRLLATSEGGSLRWDSPLLHLAQDVARGMAYLHGREYYDERDGQRKRGVLHRDLKPDNVLITEFNRAKIADFGSARGLAHESLGSTIIGTPMYAAPEIMRGESYDEKVDVYSFGVILLTMAIDGELQGFIVERWRQCQFGSMAFPRDKAADDDVAAIKVLRDIWLGKFRAEAAGPSDDAAAGTTILFTPPPTILRLIASCCAHDHAARPSFEVILATLLSEACGKENESGSFARGRSPVLVPPSATKDYADGAAAPAGRATGTASPMWDAHSSTSDGSRGSIDEESPLALGRRKSDALIRQSAIYRATGVGASQSGRRNPGAAGTSGVAKSNRQSESSIIQAPRANPMN